MANETAVNPTQALSSNRRLKFLVVILIVSNLLLGCVSAYLLRTVDRNYSVLIDRSFPRMNELRQLTKETVSMQRHVLAALVASDSVTREDSLQKLESTGARQKIHLKGLLRAEEILAKPELSKTLSQSAQVYETGIEAYLALMSAGRRDEADNLRKDLLRPSVNLYLDAIDQAAMTVEASGQALKDVYSTRAKAQGTILVGLASWPLVVGLVLAFLLAVIIGVLVLVYRRVGSEQ